MMEALPPESDGDDRQLKKIVLILGLSCVSVFHDRSQWLNTEASEGKVTKRFTQVYGLHQVLLDLRQASVLAEISKQTGNDIEPFLITSMKRVRVRGVSASVG